MQRKSSLFNLSSYCLCNKISQKKYARVIWHLLEFQDPSSCGELARFAHKYVRFTHKKVRLAHIHLFINIIMATTASNKKCLSPPSMQRCLSPPQCKNVCPPPCVWEMFVPPSLLCVRNVCPPPLLCARNVCPRGQTNSLSPTPPLMYVSNVCHPGTNKWGGPKK